MAVAVKNTPEVASAGLLDRMAVTSLAGTAYALGTLGIVFYLIPSLWAGLGWTGNTSWIVRDLIQLAADGVLIVLRPDHTKRGSCLKAFESVPKEKLIGVLLNCTKSWPLARHGRYGYGYGYGAVNSQNGRPDGKPKRAGG